MRRPHESPSEIAAHRARIEHDYIRGNPRRLQMLREAAAEFDAAITKVREAARKRGRPRKTA